MPPAPRGPPLPAEPPAWPSVLPPAFASPGGAAVAAPASISGGRLTAGVALGRFELPLLDAVASRPIGDPAAGVPSAGPNPPRHPGEPSPGAFGPTSAAWATHGPACADCGMGLSASAAWRRCPNCAGPLCPGCLIASVREHGKVLCTACAG